MPYKMEWFTEGEVVYLQYSGEPGVQELHGCLMEVNTYVEQGKRPLIHTLIDVTRVTKASTLVELAQAMKGYKPNPRVGWMITVGEQDKMVKFVASIARQILHMRQRSYNNMQQALDFLHDIDSGLHWSEANNSILEPEPQDSSAQVKG